MNIYIEIPARGGSKGVPRKALRPLGGPPLIAHTINHALTVHGATKIFVNTDDPEIRDVSLSYGAEVPFLRPDHLAQDNSDLSKAHAYALEWYKTHEKFIADVVIIMSPTYPFRRKNLVASALERGISSSDIFNIGSIAVADGSLDNFWTLDQGEAHPFTFKKNISDYSGPLYQAALSFNIVFNCRSYLENRHCPVVLDDIESIDIDEAIDLGLARSVFESERHKEYVSTPH